MNKKRRKQMISIVLVFAILISSISYGGKKETKKAQAIDLSTAFTIAKCVATVTSKTVKAAKSASSLGKGATKNEKALAVFDSLFGTNYSNKPTVSDQLEGVQASLDNVENKVDALQKDVNQINASLNVANKKLDTIDSKLDMQEETLANISDDISDLTEMVANNQLSVSSQISGMSNRLETIINNQTEELKVTLFNSTIEMQNTMTLLTKLDNYYDNFAGLASVEETILQDLEKQQKSYEAFMEAVKALKDGQKIVSIIDGMTLNYEESYGALTDEEKELLSREVTVSGTGTVTINKYLKDYMSYMHTYMTETIYAKGNGYLSNLYDTVKGMGEYITGDAKETGYVGVGEIFYQSSMLENSTNVEVHDAYKSFISSVMEDYFITAYLCQLSLAYQVTYDCVHDGNVAEISTKKDYLQNIEEQMAKVQAYYGYELNHCIEKYDFSRYKDGEYEQTLCYYGNTVNAKKGISNWRCKNKADVYVDAALSDSSLELAVSEQRPLHFYQGLEDWTSNATWTSEDESVAVVDKNGKVTGVAPGSTTITAKFDTYELECPVSVLSCYAVKNNTGKSNYHYGGKKYTLKSSRSYDYYYAADCYTGKKIVLSEERKSAGLVEATGLSEEDIKQYTWGSSDDSVASCQDGQITLTDDGSCVIYGYRYLEEADTYESIGIPVCVTEDTSSEMEAEEEKGLKDYSDYTKISTKQDLIELSQNPDKWGPDCKYVLTNDIDLGGMEWTPIGYSFMDSDVLSSTNCSELVPFQGVFEGNGHVIKDFKITKIPHQDEMIAKIRQVYEENKDTENYTVKPEIPSISVGLFGYVNGASIRNLKVTGGDIRLDTAESLNSFTIGGTEYTLTLSKNASVSAGLLAGSSALSTYEFYEELITGKDGNPPVLIDTPDDSESESPVMINPDADISAYTEDMPDYIEKLGNDSIIKVQYIMLETIKQRKFPDTTVTNTYAEGTITIDAGKLVEGDKDDEGYVYAGGLFGMCTSGVNDSSAKVSIQVNVENPSAIDVSDTGGLGGLIGCWTPWKYADLSSCTAWADIKSNTKAMAGGLVGGMQSMPSLDFSQMMFTEEMLTDPTAEELKAMETVATYSVFVEIFIMMAYYIDMEGTGAYPSTRIENCQVYGSVDAGGSAAGLLGKKGLGGQMEWFAKKDRTEEDKVAKFIFSLEDGDFAIIKTTKEIQPNLDIFECYVDVDVTTTGDYAGGIIASIAGGSMDSDVKTAKGSIQNCYVHGDIAAGKTAAGIVANQAESAKDGEKERDITVISNVIAACENISANTVDAADTAVYPTWNTKMTGVEAGADTIYYYELTKYASKQSGTDYTVPTDTTGQGVDVSAVQLNKADTYLELWSPSFCNVSGLDFVNGYLPSVLEERCFFNTEDARKYYHVGDTFEPITKGTLYTGNGSITVTDEDGVESTTPDMTESGIRTVTVSYGKQTKEYKIYIYPVTDSYIKVTKKPTLVQNGDEYTISGGKVGVYRSDGTLSKTVDMDACTVEYEDGYISISYEGMNTSMKILTLKAYANQVVGEDKLEKMGSWYYLSGDTVDVSKVVAQNREVTYEGQKEDLELLASSLSENTMITSDMYVMSLYKKAKKEGQKPEQDQEQEKESEGTSSTNTGKPKDTNTANSKQTQTTVTVSKKNAPVVTMKKTVNKGAKVTLALAKASKSVKVSYQTSNKKVATVGKTGIVKTKKKGSVTITQTVTYGDGMYIVKLKLKVQSKKVKGKLYQPSSKVVPKGKTVTYMGETLKKGKNFTLSVAKKDSSTKITYTSSNKKVATVSKTGKIKAKKKGTAKVTATIKQGKHTYYAMVVVKVVK